MKLFKIVDFIHCFPRNSMEYELRITLEFWETYVISEKYGST
jgi:hypothetical protein